ncbi:MAG: hypothetical protein Q4C73_11640, partial [Eubacteriales bacterium]|nr:hypothetical protein [Eubacteriales bacterium]
PSNEPEPAPPVIREQLAEEAHPHPLLLELHPQPLLLKIHLHISENLLVFVGCSISYVDGETGVPASENGKSAENGTWPREHS